MTGLPAAAEITVIIPTIGRSPFLREAVASAVAQVPAEIVVVADGATEVDETELAGSRLLRMESAGRSAARNRGVGVTRTEFVAFLDDDDLVLPGGFARQAEAIADAPLAFGRVQVVDGEGRPRAEWNDLLGRRFPTDAVGAAELLSRQTPIYTSATVVRRESFLAAGGYEPELDAYRS